jgi:hypothetical protein
MFQRIVTAKNLIEQQIKVIDELSEAVSDAYPLEGG